MRQSRRRFYGHIALVSYLTEFAARTYADNRKLLLIGDIGLQRGSLMLTGHDRHQNGFDADIWFMTRANSLTTVEREAMTAQSLVASRTKLRNTWGDAQVRLLVAAADDKAINRIFVSSPIKRYMCSNFYTAHWLYRLRAWWGHEDHLHISLKCTGGYTLCREQDELDIANNGCGADLDWWFSKRRIANGRGWRLQLKLGSFSNSQLRARRYLDSYVAQVACLY